MTGELTPDVTGTYNPIGLYNNKPSYQLADNGWFIWRAADFVWIISTLRGSQGTSYWTRPDPAIEGLYTPGGDATGDATVTQI